MPSDAPPADIRIGHLLGLTRGPAGLTWLPGPPPGFDDSRDRAREVSVAASDLSDSRGWYMPRVEYQHVELPSAYVVSLVTVTSTQRDATTRRLLRVHSPAGRDIGGLPVSARDLELLHTEVKANIQRQIDAVRDFLSGPGE